jgi:TRAP-type mannitol/chloroaromatic compound transport system permease small subunit
MTHVVRFCLVLERITAWPGRVAGWLIPLLTVAVCLSVAAARLRINEFLRWSDPVPLFGNSLTVNGMLDLHWHFFTMLVMLGGAFALSTNGHVQVDFLSQRFKPSTQKVIMVLGDVFFLLPFCIFMAWYGWRFTVTSFNMGEGSTYGGLLDRYFIKAFVPIGFILLGINGVARSTRVLTELVSPPAPRQAEQSELRGMRHG